GDAPPDERRALVEALGKLGGDEARVRLQALEPGADAELARRRDRALLIGERDAKRGEESAIAIDVAPPSPVTVRLHCKEGLAGLLRDDLATHGLRGTALRDDTVELSLARPWSALHASRLWIDGGIRVPLAGPSPSAIADAITSPRVRALLRAWTTGPIRWRLAVRGGHQRSLVWRVAKEVGARAKELVNDPSQTTWDIAVDTSSTEHALELVPRRAADPRFSWRVAEVPAASHPTVAAALALVAGARDGDRVWDPFCGSAAELVERARLGPCRSIVGSDIDDAALTAAQKNLDAAGVTATLVRDDARTYSPDRPGTIDLVITNPPLGSRVHVDAASLLVTTLPNIAKHLSPAGRLVWITPAPRTTATAAEKLGLRMTRRFAVDLGGVRGQLERWER
ncbi:MAG: methyltransferase, partial [Kofleriaceae bacterium]|nr:methyltransferase [Kofleriaceae bacterium]